MSFFDPKDYWEQRLQKSFDLNGVGYQRLGASFNRWAYRIRHRVFQRMIRTLTVNLATAKVIDLGSGTGFYLDRWREMGVQQISGSDLTQVAVTRLRQCYPGVPIHQLDIGCPLQGLDVGAYDIVSCMDVVFHIVDDANYQQAFCNAAQLLRPGGLFIFSDNFLHGPEVRIRHVVNRPLAKVQPMLEHAGFEILLRRPMFYVMNNPIDAGKLARLVWSGMLAPAIISDHIGWFLGAALYPLENLLTRCCTESPTTEIMICRKKSPLPGNLGAAETAAASR